MLRHRDQHSADKILLKCNHPFGTDVARGSVYRAFTERGREGSRVKGVKTKYIRAVIVSKH
jgi:hypothetical protein